MSKIFLLCLMGLVGLSASSSAQKVKREVVGKYSYTQMPIDTTLLQSKTYVVKAHGDNVDSYEKDKISGAFKLPGFKKKERSAEEYDFKIDVEMYSVKVGESERDSRVKTTKKDGVEKKTTYYWYKAPVHYKYVINIYREGEVIYSTESAGKESVRGSESTSTSQAYKNYKSAVVDYRSAVSSSKLKPISSSLAEKYCFLTKAVSLRSAHLKPKKHSYDDYDAAFELMKNGYLTVAADENEVAEASESLTEAIKAFNELLKESDPSNKKARINEGVTALLYNNIGHCYFLMKDYSLASAAYNSCKEVKRTFLDASAMMSKSDNLVARVAANKPSE